MKKRRGSRKMSRLAPLTPGLHREGGKFHGLLFWSTTLLACEEWDKTTFFGPASNQYQECAEHHHSQ
jgi:hypothetical protein